MPNASPQFYCPTCGRDLEIIDKKKNLLKCVCSELKLSKSVLQEEGCYYLHLDIEEQLVRLLGNKEVGSVGVESYVNSGMMAIFNGIQFRHKELFF